MTNLWCNHTAFPGDWVSGNGYETIAARAFSTLADLEAVISVSARPGSIRQLGIMVHGDEGELLMGSHEPSITPERIASTPALSASLQRIGNFLHGSAEVRFYSCSAAASTRGSELLKALSLLWPGRTVVGSITKGYRFATLTAGQISDTLLTVIESVPHTGQYFVPGQSSRMGRSQFNLPASLPRFLTVQATTQRASNGEMTQVANGPAAYQQFDWHYPSDTKNMILAHPAMMMAGGTLGLLGWGTEGESASQTSDPASSQFDLSRAVPGSECQLYSTFLINMDWPPGYGRRALQFAAATFPGW
jgi:hypothetical protein